MAGSLAAGLMVGRSPMLTLVAGLTAAAGLKAILRQSTCASASPAGRRRSVMMSPAGAIKQAGPVDCCTGEEKSPEPGFLAPDRAAVGQPDWAAEMPLIWEAGQGEPVSCGAGHSQTVWFEMREPMEAVPSVPALEGTRELPESFFRETPAGDLDSLPAVPAIGVGSGAATGSDSADEPPARRSGGLAHLVSQMLAGGKAGTGVPALPPVPVEEELWQDARRRGPHRSVLPQAPVDSGPAARWMMLITAAVLVLVALAMVLGIYQGDGWFRGLKQRWHVSRGGPHEQSVEAVGGPMTSRPGEK